MDSLLKKVIIINQKDNVAVAIKKLQKNENYGLEEKMITIKDDIEPACKVAISPIKQGDVVIKYGEIIGRSITSIEAGEFVHTHNLEGTRGRGDQLDNTRS